MQPKPRHPMASTHATNSASTQASAVASVFVIALCFSGAAMAQMNMDHSKAAPQTGMSHGQMPMSPMSAVATAPSMTDGEVRKIDHENGKVTIKHGEIKHMDMPPMTMVFTAKDKALLDKVQVGEKVQFVVVQEGGRMVVTDIQPAK